MRHPIAGIAMLLASVLNIACGSSPTGPSATPQTQSGTGLLVTEISVSAMLERWPAVPWDIGYFFCYSMASTSPEVANLTFRRVDYTTIGPTGAVYDTGSDATLIGQPVGVGRLGCFFTYRDQNITRPVAKPVMRPEAAVPDRAWPTRLGAQAARWRRIARACAQAAQ